MSSSLHMPFAHYFQSHKPDISIQGEAVNLNIEGVPQFIRGSSANAGNYVGADRQPTFIEGNSGLAFKMRHESPVSMLSKASNARNKMIDHYMKQQKAQIRIKTYNVDKNKIFLPQEFPDEAPMRAHLGHSNQKIVSKREWQNPSSTNEYSKNPHRVKRSHDPRQANQKPKISTRSSF